MRFNITYEERSYGNDNDARDYKLEITKNHSRFGGFNQDRVIIGYSFGDDVFGKSQHCAYIKHTVLTLSHEEALTIAEELIKIVKASEDSYDSVTLNYKDGKQVDKIFSDSETRKVERDKLLRRLSKI